jgi:glycosyltransferase involved in cell wall biosynthesis
LISQLRLGDSVILAGHVDQIADVYAAADLVVNPVRVNEAFGRVPFEAAIAGRPSVVTGVGAVPELLRDGESALIVAPGDPAAIAAGAIRLLNDPELGARLVASARVVVADRLTPEQSLAGFQRAVAATLARAAPR